MKILFITGSLNQGGAEYQILMLAKLFQDKGHNVQLFAITDYSFYKPFIKESNLKYEHLLNNQSSIRRIFLTTKMVRKEKPDLIISYLKRVSQVALFAKVFSGVKTKIIVGERTAFVQPRYDKLHFSLMRFANFITVNSISKFNYLKKTFPFLKNKVAFTPNIIDIQKYNILHKNFNSKIFNIGFVGRISPEKNVINLIRAVKLLTEKGYEVRLLIYGDARNPGYIEKLNSLIEKNSLENMVLLKGRLDDANLAYQTIDLLCLISDYEGFSNVISEALCCGLPVVTSDIEENKYLIENKVNGFVVNQKDPESISQGILSYMMLSNKLKLKMTKTNRTKAEQIFDKQTLYNNYLEIINSLM